MPSPVAHSLIGLAVAAQCGVRPGSWREIKSQARALMPVLFSGVALANLPDLDYLPGIIGGDLNAYHHLYTHSVGWVGLASLSFWCIWKIIRPSAGLREFAFVAIAAGSHLLADWLTADARPPYGIMLWWPFERGFHLCPLSLFDRLHKRDWSELLQWHNAWAVLRETVICLPLLLAVVLGKLRAGRSRGDGAGPVSA